VRRLARRWLLESQAAEAAAVDILAAAVVAAIPEVEAERISAAEEAEVHIWAAEERHILAVVRHISVLEPQLHISALAPRLHISAPVLRHHISAPRMRVSPGRHSMRMRRPVRTLIT
jgi:hypothetical protein